MIILCPDLRFEAAEGYTERRAQFSWDFSFLCGCKQMLVFSCSAGPWEEEAPGMLGRWAAGMLGGVCVHSLP